MVHKCKCGARWRINRPFGKKSRARVVFLVEHKQSCIYKKYQNEDK